MNEAEPASTSVEAPPLTAAVEAALLTAERALSAARLSEVMDEATAADIRDAVTQLNTAYEDTGRSFRIEEVAGGYQMVTLPAFAPVLEKLSRKRADSKLSPAAMETLAIIAYKQPIIRAEIEAIRGVACGEVLRSLMERRLIRITGRAEEIGRPMLYGTTTQFLEVFGLANVKDLPKVEGFKMPDPPASSPTPASDEATEEPTAANPPEGDAPAEPGEPT